MTNSPADLAAAEGLAAIGKAFLMIVNRCGFEKQTRMVKVVALNEEGDVLPVDGDVIADFACVLARSERANLVWRAPARRGRRGKRTAPTFVEIASLRLDALDGAGQVILQLRSVVSVRPLLQERIVAADDGTGL